LPAAVEVAELKSWTELGGEGVKAFSGTARYTLTFARPAGVAGAAALDLGRVAESARVKLNGVDLGVVFTAPYRVAVPAGLLRDENTLEIEVANLMANRVADLDRRGVPWKKFYNTNMPARLPANRGPDGNFTAAQWPPRASGPQPVTIVPRCRSREPWVPRVMARMRLGLFSAAEIQSELIVFIRVIRILFLPALLSERRLRPSHRCQCAGLSGIVSPPSWTGRRGLERRAADGNGRLAR
jgi:hypothetical protein